MTNHSEVAEIIETGRAEDGHSRFIEADTDLLDRPCPPERETETDHDE